MVEINPPMPEVAPQETIVEMIRARAQEHPEKEALVCGDTRLTWGAFDVRVNRGANALIARGIGRGKVVCGLELANSLRALKTLSQRVDNDRVQTINAFAVLFQKLGCARCRIGRCLSQWPILSV